MTTSRPALDRLADQNPVPAPDESATPLSRESVERILLHAREKSEPRRRKVVLVAAVAVAVLVAGTIGIVTMRDNGIDNGGGVRPVFALPGASAAPIQLAPLDGSAGTPAPLKFVAFDRPVESGELLQSLADAAGRQPSAPGVGQYEYFKTREWGFYTRQTQDGVVFDHGIAESLREDWRGPDGAGRMETTQDGQFDRVDVPPQPPLPGIAVNPTDSRDGVRQRLLEAGQSWSAEQWFDAYRQEYGAHILSPLAQEAYLQALGQQSGSEVVGEVVDRAGRSGVAVSAASNDIRLVLIFDPDSGALLDFERIALSENAVEISVPVPSTVGYTVFLDRGRAPTVESRP